MRRFWAFSFLSIVISPIALFAQEWALEADIELARAKGAPCLPLGGAFVLERYGESRCVP